VGSGRIDVVDGAVPLPGIGAVYQNLTLHGAFDGNRLVVRQAHAISSKGSLDVTGELTFVSVARVEPHLRVTMRQFVFVDTPDLRAVASGTLEVSGTVLEPMVKGDITISKSSYSFVQSDVAADTSNVRLTDADIRSMEETFGYVSPEAPALPLRLYDASDLDLGVTLERNNWVRQQVQPRLSVALSGKFRLKKPPHQEPQLFGKIEPVPNRGYVEQFARSFDITGGEILLNGPMTSHTIDIQAQYGNRSISESGNTDIMVNLDVQGTIDKLSLTLSSDPPMSEAEIVNYIATGRSTADNNTNDSKSSLAKDIGLSTVTGGAEQAAQQAIGLDVVQVRFDALQGAILVAGRYLDPQFYVGFRQPLQHKDAGATSNTETARTSVELEYAIYRWLVVNLQSETSKVRSFLRARYAY
jgi:autotransporter translocation and assembly factor TamB